MKKFIGYDDQLNTNEKFTYIINAFQICNVLLFFFYYITVVKSTFVTSMTLMIILLMLSAYYFLKKRWFTFAKIIIFASFFIQESACVFLWFPPESQFQYYYFIILPTSFFILSVDNLKERIVLILVNIIAIALLLLSNIFPNQNAIIEIPDNVSHVFSSLTIIMTVASIGIVFFFYAVNLRNTMNKLEIMANTDSLTKISNRRILFNQGEEIFKTTKQFKDKFSLVLIDIDYFKHINDTYGHPTGDLVLKQLTEVISKNIRRDDIFARYGGEEFALLLRGDDEDLLVPQRIADAINHYDFKAENKKTIKLTVSMGVTIYKEKYGDFDEMVMACDKALYMSKENGRNRITTI